MIFVRRSSPGGVPIKSSAVHASQNIRILVEYLHRKLRPKGLDARFWDLEEFKILPSVLFIEGLGPCNEADLLDLPFLMLHYPCTDDRWGGFLSGPIRVRHPCTDSTSVQVDHKF